MGGGDVAARTRLGTVTLMSPGRLLGALPPHGLLPTVARHSATPAPHKSAAEPYGAGAVIIDAATAAASENRRRNRR
jgi:hypothetical protein